MRGCDDVKMVALKATNADCGEIAALASSVFKDCGTVIQRCGQRDVVMGHNKLLSKIAVERICGNVRVEHRAALYVRWGDQKSPVWNSEVKWTTPTLKHAEELVDRLAVLSNFTELDLFMEGATLDTIADFKYLNFTHLISNTTIHHDICALASYEYIAYGAATIAGLVALYKSEDKVIVSATIWQDSDERPVDIKESLYGKGNILVK